MITEVTSYFADCMLQSELMCFICNQIKEKTDSSNQKDAWISDLIILKANDLRHTTFSQVLFVCVTSLLLSSLKFMINEKVLWCLQLICLNSAANFSAGLCRGHSLSLAPWTRTYVPQGSGSLTRWHCQQVWQRSRPVRCVWSPWHFPFVSTRWAYTNVLETIPFSGDWKALLPARAPK